MHATMQPIRTITAGGPGPVVGAPMASAITKPTTAKTTVSPTTMYTWRGASPWARPDADCAGSDEATPLGSVLLPLMAYIVDAATTSRMMPLVIAEDPCRPWVSP